MCTFVYACMCASMHEYMHACARTLIIRYNNALNIPKYDFILCQKIILLFYSKLYYKINIDKKT